MADARRITVIGTGLMGFPMAHNLLKAGHKVTVWNRSSEKAAPLQAYGARVAETLGQSVDGAEVVISMLSDGKIVGGVIADPDVRANLGDGAIWVDMSSTKPEEARATEKSLNGLGVRFIDAPVSGGTKGAEAASLAIMAGGSGEDFEDVKDALSSMGHPVRVGPVGSGQLAKLANQAIVGITIGAVAEAMLLLERGGADPAAVRDALKGGFADSTILQQHGRRMTERNFIPGGLSRLQVKDLDNVLSEADTFGLTLPVVQHIRDRFARYVDEMGGGDKDHSGLFEELMDRNGLS